MNESLTEQPRRDLESPEDVAELVRRFYGDVAQDDLLGPVFNEVAQVNWSVHLEKLTLFWCRALLGIQGYSGNPFRQHSIVHGKVGFTLAQFDRWLELFSETLELGWAGPNVDKALELACNVARVHSLQLVGQSVDTSPHQTLK